MKESEKIFSYVCFWFFVILTIGYAPERISRIFLLLAVLSCPVGWIRKWMDWGLSHFTVRMMLMLLLVVILGFYPLEDFKLIGIRVMNVWKTLSRWINTVFRL